MSGTLTSKDSAAFCANLVRTHDFARYASTLFLPQVQRRALLSLSSPGRSGITQKTRPAGSRITILDRRL
jgi:hypothetical protein